MADLRLEPRGALEGFAKPGRHGAGEARVTLSVLPDGPQTTVVARRGQAEALVAACAARGLALPGPGRASFSRDLTAVATAPGQWLLLGGTAQADPDHLFAPLASLCSLVRVDDARTLIAVAGPAARDTLAKVLTIDLHPRAFATGAAAVTPAGDIGVVIWQTDDAPRYVLAVQRSLARSAWDWLVHAAAEYGAEVRLG